MKGKDLLRLKINCSENSHVSFINNNVKTSNEEENLPAVIYFGTNVKKIQLILWVFIAIYRL